MHRRSVLLGVASLACASSAYGQTCDSHSETAILSQVQSGDVVWPAHLNAKIWLGGPDPDAIPTHADWEAARQDALWKANKAGDQATANTLKSLEGSYEEFRAKFAPQTVERRTPLGGMPDWTPQPGHAAIIQVIDGKPHVIEAMPDRNVRATYFGWACTEDSKVKRVAYDDWRRARTCQGVWIGRLARYERAERAAVAEAAAGEIGKCYDVSNTSLLSGNSHYCSKLIWYSAHKALKADLARALELGIRWLSPLDLYSSADFCLLHAPNGQAMGGGTSPGQSTFCGPR